MTHLQQQAHRRDIRNLIHDRTEPSGDVRVPVDLQRGGRVVELPALQQQPVGFQEFRYGPA